MKKLIFLKKMMKSDPSGASNRKDPAVTKDPSDHNPGNAKV